MPVSASPRMARPGFIGVITGAPGMADGAPDRTRTCNRQLRRLVLYPIELRALVRSRLPSLARQRTFKMPQPDHPWSGVQRRGHMLNVSAISPLRPIELRAQEDRYEGRGTRDEKRSHLCYLVPHPSYLVPFNLVGV